jgi:hypothetical protein
MKKIIFLLLLLAGIYVMQRGWGTDYYEVAKQKIAQYAPNNKNYVIVIDYRKNILQKRLYVIDMKTGEYVIESRVSHAFKTGVLYPSNYSNVVDSKKSSVGDFITLNQIQSPKCGFSMQLKGLNEGVNDNATRREIIFHSTNCMKLLWSHGCFATPEETNRKIINLTKNGCLVVVIS